MAGVTLQHALAGWPELDSASRLELPAPTQAQLDKLRSLFLRQAADLERIRRVGAPLRPAGSPHGPARQCCALWQTQQELAGPQEARQGAPGQHPPDRGPATTGRLHCCGELRPCSGAEPPPPPPLRSGPHGGAGRRAARQRHQALARGGGPAHGLLRHARPALQGGDGRACRGGAGLPMCAVPGGREGVRSAGLRRRLAAARRA